MDSSTASERTELDPIFKQILNDLGKHLNFTPQTEVEVSYLPRKIDAIIQLDDPTEQRRLELESSFIRLRAHNQLEFKGRGDPLYRAGYHTIRGRTRFYLSQHDLNFAAMSVSIVCARKPIKLLGDKQFDFQPIKNHPGYYLGQEQLPSVLIVINELPIIPKHYPLLLFASSEQTFRQTLQQILRDEQHHPYLHYAYIVRPTITQEEVIMSRSAYLTDENLTFILQDIGEELMIRLTDKELVQKSPAYQALIAEWEQRLKQSEKKVKQIEKKAKQNEQKAKLVEQQAKQSEQKAKQIEQQAKQSEKQHTLLRILSHRFGDLPTSIIEHVEGTTDIELLDRLLEKALEINHLDEFS